MVATMSTSLAVTTTAAAQPSGGEASRSTTTALEPGPLAARSSPSRSKRDRASRLRSCPSSELATAAGSGDEEAAGELYRRTQSRARRVACGFCGDADADDAVAEGLFTALRRIGQLRDPAAVEAWMLRCVVRCAIDLARQRRRQAPTEGVAALQDAGPWISGPSAAETAMLALERHSMAEVVQEIPPHLRFLLYLRYEAGLSVQHIASAFGKPPGTVRRQCVEARRSAGQRFLCRHLRPAAGQCAVVTAHLCAEPYRRLGARTRRQTTEHLRVCRACRERQAELTTVLTELGFRRRKCRPRPPVENGAAGRTRADHPRSSPPRHHQKTVT